VHPDDWYKPEKIDLILGRKVTELNPSTQTIRVDNGDTIHYDKLLLATGATPVKPDIAGANLPNVQTMRRWDDSDALKPFMGKRIVIVGGGYIGVEVSAGSAQDGGHPTILERSNRILGRSISPQLSEWFAGKLKKAGVAIVFNVEVDSITPSGVLTKDGRMFEA